VTREVIYSPEANDDLIELYNYIADRGAPNAALAYIERVDARCAGLADFPEQGIRRDDIQPGLRVVAFERRTAIAFHITPDIIVIDRIFHGGQNVDAGFED
jgi:toxin ParE1/3/4